MKNKITKLITAIIITFGFITITNTVTPVFAANSTNSSDSTDICTLKDENGNYAVPESVRAANGCKDVGSQVAELPNVVRNILNAIIGVMGLVAVIFIVRGGIGYMTSTGDATKTKKARDTILYSLIGLVVCALAFAIVNFTVDHIINQSTSTNQGTTENTKETKTEKIQNKKVKTKT